ncbi:MAG: rhomboid family intramembrane serine protease [Erysipelotrichaceae bacterium]
MNPTNNAKVMQVVEFLINHHHFQTVNVDNRKDELWLFSKSDEMYSLIRVSAKSIEQIDYEKDRLKKSIAIINHQLGLNKRFLNIYIGKDPVYPNEPFDTAMLDEGFKDGISLEPFYPGIDRIVHEVENPVAEMKKISLNLMKKSHTMQTNKKKFVPVATYCVIGVCLLVYGLSVFLTNFTSSLALDAQSVSIAILLGAYYKEFIVVANEYWRLFTCGFVHIDFLHILFNIIAMNSLGSFFERTYGYKNMLFILFASIIGGSIFVFLGSDNTITLGLSGGLYGLMASMVVHAWYTGLLKQPAVRNQMISLLMMNLVITLMPGISMLGHIGGFFTGLLLSISLIKDEKIKTFIRNAKISLLIGAFALLFMVVQTDTVEPEYLGNDLEVIDLVQSLGLDGYASYLTEHVSAYYMK